MSQPQRIPNVATGLVNDVAFSSDQNVCATATDDGGVYIWNLEKQTSVRVPYLDSQGKSVQLKALQYCPTDPNILVIGAAMSAAFDTPLRVWQEDKQDTLYYLNGDVVDVPQAIRFSADGSRMAVGYYSSRVSLFGVDVGSRAFNLQFTNNTASFEELWDATICSDGSFLASSASIPGGILWQADTQAPYNLDPNTAGSHSVGFSNDQRLLAVGGPSRLFLWVEGVERSFGSDVLGQNGMITSVGFTPDGNRVLALQSPMGMSHARAFAFDWQNGAITENYDFGSSHLGRLSVSSTGVAAFGADNDLTIWHVDGYPEPAFAKSLEREFKVKWHKPSRPRSAPKFAFDERAIEFLKRLKK